MRSALLILCLTCASIPSLPPPGPRHETVTGRIVAYSPAMACLNGNAYWSMIVRVQQPKDAHSEFIRVDFSLPCKNFPEWVTTKPSIQKFHLFRQKNCEEVLAGSAGDEPTQNSSMPFWKYPPGAEHVTLPFGETIRCCRSLDLPLVPVV